MHTEYFFIYQSADWEVLKSLTELFPQLYAVFIESSLARVLESVDLVDQAALMISSEHVDEAWVPQLIRKQKSNYLHIIRVPVNVITLEQIFFVRGWTDLVEETK